MAAATLVLVPVQELSPGAVAAIRNSVINQLVTKVSAELSKSPNDLVVRDVRPSNDLRLYSGGTTTSTIDEWIYDATTTTAAAFTSITGDALMGDQKFVALFGVRDLRRGLGIHTTNMAILDATASWAQTGTIVVPGAMVNFIRINVGGSTKVIWDVSGLEAYSLPIAFSPAPIIIPQNTTYNIGYYFKSTAAGFRAYLQLIGVVVEPRGLTVSP